MSYGDERDGENSRASIERLWYYHLNLPKKVINEINLLVDEAREQAYMEVLEQNKEHKGYWLTEEVAYRYAKEAKIYRRIYGEQYIGEIRSLGEELQKQYGVTEIEAINILFERNVRDYVNKYYRLRKMIPNDVNQEKIFKKIIFEVLDEGKSLWNLDLRGLYND